MFDYYWMEEWAEGRNPLDNMWETYIILVLLVLVSFAAYKLYVKTGKKGRVLETKTELVQIETRNGKSKTKEEYKVLFRYQDSGEKKWFKIHKENVKAIQTGVELTDRHIKLKRYNI